MKRLLDDITGALAMTILFMVVVSALMGVVLGFITLVSAGHYIIAGIIGTLLVMWAVWRMNR